MTNNWSWFVILGLDPGIQASLVFKDKWIPDYYLGNDKQKQPFKTVIPAKAGIQFFQSRKLSGLDPPVKPEDDKIRLY
jgi:hypothetical protein